ncbi:hypothetical protein [Geodermatophilus sp. SYSU D00684]
MTVLMVAALVWPAVLLLLGLGLGRLLRRADASEGARAAVARREKAEGVVSALRRRPVAAVPAPRDEASLAS